MNISTQTTTIVHLELTEAEARSALVDPSQITSQLRAALAPVASARQTRKSPMLGKRVSDPKAKAAGSRKSIERQPCPKCSRLLSPQGLARHLPTCRGEQFDPAG